MQWLVTFGADLPYDRLCSALADRGIDAPPKAHVIPLDRNEFTVEITATRRQATELRALPGVRGLHPVSPMQPY